MTAVSPHNFFALVDVLMTTIPTSNDVHSGCVPNYQMQTFRYCRLLLG